MSKPQRGFTLLELLVVMVILAILAALLFPALKRVQATSRRTVCSHNLRQINLGVRMYSDDSDDKPPASGWAAASTQRTRDDQNAIEYDPPAGYEYQWSPN